MDTMILSMRGLDLLADCLESARDGLKEVGGSGD